MRLRATPRGRQDDIARLCLACQEMVPRETFFDQEHIGRPMAGR